MLEKIKVNFKKFIIPSFLVVIALVFLITPSVFQTNTAQPEKNPNKVGSAVTNTREASQSAEKKAVPKELTTKSLPRPDSVETTVRKVFQQTIAEPHKQENQKKEIVDLRINIGSSRYSYQVSWSEGVTVYAVLVKASSENKFSLVARWYGAPLNSYYVTELHGHNCECWTYTVKDKDGKDVPGKGKGVSLDTLGPDDIISWKAT